MADERNPGRLTHTPADGLDALICQRRSIRKYKSDPLPEAWMTAILRCAHQAPSPSNCQPVRYIRIDSTHHRGALQRALIEGHGRLIAEHNARGASARLRNWINAYRRFSEFMFTAPVLLAVGVEPGIESFASKLAAAGLIPDNRQPQCDLDMTVGLALKGLILKAQSLGAGCCILTAPLVFIPDAVSRLDLDKFEIKCFVTLGIPDETPKPTERKPLDAVVQVI